MSNALAIFAKAPIVGQVKTRLCPPLTPEQAADLFRCFLLDTVERMCGLEAVEVFVAITPADSEPLFRSLIPFPVRYQPQRGASLGERQINTLSDMLAAGFSRTLIIGSDIPTLPVAYVQEAFRRLEDPACDAVFGPSRDGGYYLVGVRQVHRPLFENIAWSTPQVLQQTLEQARKHRYAVALVPSWYDVDRPEDLPQLVRDIRGRTGGPDDVPRTRQALTRLKRVSNKEGRLWRAV
jgi:rSAM/selenodomain-associated transferase 1